MEAALAGSPFITLVAWSAALLVFHTALRLIGRSDVSLVR